MIPVHRTLSHPDFDARVDAWTAAAVREGAKTFAPLLRRLPGVYPTELLASVDRLVARGALDANSAATIRQQSKVNDRRPAEGRSLLPLPHPLDFEWRFTSESSRTLLDQAAALTRSGDDLLLFGTPGLAVEALSSPIGRQMTLLAEANSVTDRLLALNRATGSPLSIAFCGDGLPRESANAVLLDPPWYPDFVRPMLAAAAHACRLGGTVLISLPPDGARPSAAADRHAAVALGARLGLSLQEDRPLAIGYETPFFEYNALTAAGIATPPQWRRGDLMIFRKIDIPSRPPAAFGHTRAWTEIVIGRMRLFIRARPGVPDRDRGLVPVVDGDVLPTVSRRDPRRRLADVWTSGNRIFGSDNPKLVLEAAISCVGEAAGSGNQPRPWGTVREREAIERVARELRDLAAIEAAEEGGAAIDGMERSLFWKSSSTNYLSMSRATHSG
jgi:hypothetical protein